MPRPAVTPVQRFASVKIAADDMPAALARLARMVDDHGYSAPETIRAAEIVETLGATIHRNARILAGKSRGG